MVFVVSSEGFLSSDGCRHFFADVYYVKNAGVALVTFASLFPVCGINFLLAEIS